MRVEVKVKVKVKKGVIKMTHVSVISSQGRRV